MDKVTWQDLNTLLEKIKVILNDSLYRTKENGKLSDSELTELIMMSGYIHNITNGERKEVYKAELEKLKLMQVRYEEIEKSLR